MGADLKELGEDRESLLWVIRRLVRADARVTALELRVKRIKRARHHRRKRKQRRH